MGDESDITQRLTRRGALKYGGALVGGSVGVGALTVQTQEASAALTAPGWTVSGDTVRTDDGTIADVLLYDGTSDGTGIELVWEGFENSPTDILLELKVDDADSTSDSPATIASGTVSVSGLSGSATYSWQKAFGLASAGVSVPSNASNFSVTDFEAGTDGNSAVTSLNVTLYASANSGSVTASVTDVVDFTVDNIDANVSVGGSGDGTIKTS